MNINENDEHLLRYVINVIIIIIIIITGIQQRRVQPDTDLRVQSCTIDFRNTRMQSYK